MERSYFFVLSLGYVIPWLVVNRATVFLRLSVLRDLWCSRTHALTAQMFCIFYGLLVSGFLEFHSNGLLPFCITLLLCPFRAVVSRWQGGCTFSYFHTQDWYWLLCLPGYDWGAFFVNILYLVVLEWCLGVGWVLLFLSPLIICSSIPLRWCCTRIPIGCTWWHCLFKGREWYRHRVLTFMFRGQC